MPIGPSKPIADRVSIYVRVSRLKLYGPRWPECKAHLQPDESPASVGLCETPLPPAGVFAERSNVHGVECRYADSREACAR